MKSTRLNLNPSAILSRFVDQIRLPLRRVYQLTLNAIVKTRYTASRYNAKLEIPPAFGFSRFHCCYFYFFLTTTIHPQPRYSVELCHTRNMTVFQGLTPSNEIGEMIPGKSYLNARYDSSEHVRTNLQLVKSDAHDEPRSDDNPLAPPAWIGAKPSTFIRGTYE